ncbi:ABC transporter ATP-binding protein [Rhodohalobacter sp. 614A]|uniref:ABC transporter ATP-binding protein n=1 Tax=Rhodohalobacter sp. 614A TaxID=2908649 RepID=UPI001F38912A|nr:ABC transporter ATP-binding protein [Rhodohalobacter sp. 614A]
MDSFKKLNRYLKKYRGIILLGALFLTGSNFFLIWIPVLIRRTMDRVEQLGTDQGGQYESMMDILFSSEAGEILAFNSLLLVGTVLLYGILLFATRQTLIVSSRKIEFDIRNRVMDKLLVLPQRYFASNTSGEIYVRATEDIARVREYFGPVLMYTINTFTRAGFIISMMIIVNPTLTFWALVPLPFLSAFAYWVSGFINKYQVIIQEQYSRIAGKANETFSSIRLIKAYNRQEYEQKKFEAESEDYRKKKLRLDLVESLFHPTLNLLIGVSVVIVVWKGGVMVIDDQITVGNIAEFVIYVAYLTWPVAALGYTVNTLQKSLASWERINNMLSEPIEIRDKNRESGSVSSEMKGEIEFRNVSFRYPGSEEFAIRNINMKIPAGSNIAIVGRTGAGKTSLVNLIPRLFDPTEGDIFIDGVNVKNWNLADLRKSIGYVPQETFLFSTTIKENIAFGVEDASMEQVEEAADSAQVLDNILDFEKKFETLVGERGITLSGGQKQRTAIARAIIKKPGIVIFDDSLSAVDTKTEDAILEHLRVKLAHVTTIMISHRISTVKNADTIFYIQEGSIVESGTHDELIEVEGRYFDMYRKQLLEQELAQI